MITKAQAITSLRGGAEWALRGDDLEWLDTKQSCPTETEIQAEITRLQAEYDAKQYQRDRAVAYPSIPDQLDQIYHEGIDAWKATIQAVKAKYPKG
jgi:hypothetical protein